LHVPTITADAIIALITLAGLEVVLGIDNVVFIAILCGKLPEQQRDMAR
jgi:predicted tellurium resistance membrane protein TerC